LAHYHRREIADSIRFHINLDSLGTLTLRL
jgi:hypothetical protein